MTELIFDVKHAFRLLTRFPGFFCGLVLTLALGTGANASVFSIAHAVLIKPLPYRQPEHLVMLWRGAETAGPASEPQQSVRQRGLLTGAMVCESRRDGEAIFTDLAVAKLWQQNLEAQFDVTLGDRTERLRGAFATPNMFDVLGVSAHRGRLFSDGDANADQSAVVISYGLWQRDFAGDSGLIGRRLTLTMGRENRAPRALVVIGVLPPTFRFTYPEETEAWVLTPWNSINCGRAVAYHAVGRLRPDVALDAAEARLSGSGTRSDVGGTGVLHLETIADWISGDVKPTLVLLVSVSVLMLVITCATVASGLLVRFTERDRELAIRASLGASRVRLLRQLLTEGAVWAAIGTSGGAVLAAAMTPALRAIVPATFTRADSLQLSIPALAFGVAVAGVTTLMSFVAPAWRATSAGLASSLKRTSGVASADVSTTRWRTVLVLGQACLTTVLLVGASLLLISMWRLLRVPLGFHEENVLTAEMRLLDLKYWPQGHSNPRELAAGPMGAFQRALVANTRALPGVVDVGLSTAIPFRGVDFTYLMNRVGQATLHVASARTVDAGYFAVMQIGLTRGRLFGVADTASSPRVMVISESYARQMFGSDSPLGQYIDVGEPAEVIGVVADVRYQGYDREPRPAVYIPTSQEPSELTCLVVRTAPGNHDLAQAIRQVVFRLDPAVPVVRVATLEQTLEESIASRKFCTFATTSFGLLALLLTMLGLAVVVARFIAAKQRELAIRATLGATPLVLVQLVLRHGLAPIFAGSLLGAALAYLSAQTVETFLFQMTAREPLVYVGAVLAVALGGLSVSLIPALRVTRIDPVGVLKAE